MVHHTQPSSVSITQLCETGVAYNLDEIKKISEITHKHDLNIHMDGARFANALVSLNCTPAEMTWKSGIDVLSFGATKNGCLAAEAIIFFKPELVGNLPFLMIRRPPRSTQGVSSAASDVYKRQIDVLSFGATKNGCLAAEAIIFFKPCLLYTSPSPRDRG